ncbi:MAG: DNA-processing protein DprA [Acetobacteraceae bacterium]
MRQDTDFVDRLRLIRTESVGPVTYRRLIARYGSAAAALDALPRLARAGGRQAPPAIPATSEIVREIEAILRGGGKLLFHGDPDYPPLLGMLDDAPAFMVVLGDPGLLSARAVAEVGGRNASANGQRMAETLAAELARDVVVVSGLARGIDTAAHEGALRSGRTIAVIAGGFDVPYPPENAALQARIAEQGAVVTESPPGTTPQSRHFPRRNRIIAGLSLGVVVVEAALRSGSLITARIAQDAGREVFAVPGSPLDPRARGGNDLIRQGAILVESASDVLDNLGGGLEPPLLRTGVSEPDDAWKDDEEIVFESEQARKIVLGMLSPDPTKVDDLVRRCQFSSSAVMAVLLELELAGRVQTLPGSRVALLPEAAF